jgi:uncharacterized protein (TIGR03435 family)
VDCSQPRTATSAAQLEAAMRGAAAGGTIPCGMISTGPSGIRAGGVTMATLVSLLSSSLSSTVIDKTNLTGTYSLILDFNLLNRVSLSASAPGETLMAMPSSDPYASGSGGSVFSAVKELGLRLEKKREAVDVLVIDSVEQPDED